MESLDCDGVSVTTEQNTYHVTVRRFPAWVDIVYSVEAATVEEATQYALDDDGVFIEMRDGEDSPSQDIQVRHIELIEKESDQ
jgi:hypothetical protein